MCVTRESRAGKLIEQITGIIDACRLPCAEKLSAPIIGMDGQQHGNASSSSSASVSASTSASVGAGATAPVSERVSEHAHGRAGTQRASKQRRDAVRDLERTMCRDAVHGRGMLHGATATGRLCVHRRGTLLGVAVERGCNQCVVQRLGLAQGGCWT